MASTKPFVLLGKTLPPSLTRFFARYPPAAILPGGKKPPKTQYQLEHPDPFKFYKHPVTLKWHDPVYSLRRQAQLIKLAREHGVQELMPESTKDPEAKLAKRVEFGLRVKGTGVGQHVKGHKHERTLNEKMRKRREAMLAMPDLIKRWKKVGSRHWKQFPK